MMLSHRYLFLLSLQFFLLLLPLQQEKQCTAQQTTNTMNVEEIKAHFELQGYVVLQQFLDPSVVEPLTPPLQVFFKGVFRELYQQGHTRFPEESRLRIDDDGKRRRDYSMPRGPQHGISENMIMTSRKCWTYFAIAFAYLCLYCIKNDIQTSFNFR